MTRSLIHGRMPVNLLWDVNVDMMMPIVLNMVELDLSNIIDSVDIVLFMFVVRSQGEGGETINSDVVDGSTKASKHSPI